MFEIEFTPEAIDDIRFFKKGDRRRILKDIELQLKHEPATEARNRKKLRPNHLAEWELRIERFRVFYDVSEDKEQVTIFAVGFKDGNRLYIQGEEYAL